MSQPNNLALAVEKHKLGHLQEAEVFYRAALKDQPGNGVALGNLGIMANQLGNHVAAIPLLQQAIMANPNHSENYNQLGIALTALKKKPEAIANYKLAVQHNPQNAEAYYNLAIETTDVEESLTALNNAISIKPEFAAAHNALGIIYDRQGKTQTAITAYRRAIELNPNLVFAYSNLGNCLQNIKENTQALNCYQQALRINPNFIEASFNMGTVLEKLGKITEAAAAFKNTLRIKPNFTEARFNLIRLEQSICDWSAAHLHDDLSYAKNNPAGVDPFFMLAQNSSLAQQLDVAKAYAGRASVPQNNIFTHQPASKSKIHIGYISGNFHSHPNSYLSVGLFESHDRTKFEVFGYSYGFDDKSPIRQRTEKSFDHFADIKTLSHFDAAKKIYEDKIDILIDRQGYTTGHRMAIMAYRPAPIQVNYLGYPGTMGAEYMDYIIVDPHVVKPEEQEFYTEKFAFLPHCYQSTDNKQQIAPETPTRKECGLPENAFVFCCFNNANKIRPEFFDIWMRLLKATPNSVLWLLSKNNLVEGNLKKEAAARGVEPDRLIFAPAMPHAKHLARHKLADLFLDTLPYNAHTTASDALWAGLPLITCTGNNFAGRVGASILKAIGLPELVATNLQEYEALALKLTHPNQLSATKARLQQNRLSTPLFDTALYTKNLEGLYMQMWQTHLAGYNC